MRLKLISDTARKATFSGYKRDGQFRMLSSDQVKPLKSIPGLEPLPIIGALHHFIPGIGKIGSPENFFAMTEKLHKLYGPIVKLEGIFQRATIIMFFEPEHFDQVFRAEDVLPLRPGFDTSVYYRTTLRKEVFDGVYGLTTAQGPDWRHFRTKVNPVFLKPKLVKLYEPALDEIAKQVVERLVRLTRDGTNLQNNFDVEMTKYSLEAVAYIGLGSRVGCLDDDVNEDHPGRVLMKCAKDVFDLSFKLEFAPHPWRYISTPNFKKLMDTYDKQWEVSAKFIKEAQNKINERTEDVPEEDKSIIEKLLAIDERVAIMMANEMLLAGIDTVAFATTSLLYDLAMNQGIQDKLREEIRSGEPNRRYLKACLKETLRLRPVVTANLRRTSKEHTVGGYQIPAGVDVVAPNEYLSRQEKYYPRPTEFIPERWLADKTDPLYYGNVHPMVTQPFGFGIRSCIGRRIAEMEIELFVQRLIRDCKVSWEGPPIQIVTRIMNTFKKPYYFKFEDIK